MAAARGWAELRFSPAAPGPLPNLTSGPRSVAGEGGPPVAPYPGLARLWFVNRGDTFCADAGRATIRCGYADREYDLDAF